MVNHLIYCSFVDVMPVLTHCFRRNVSGSIRTREGEASSQEMGVLFQ